MTDSVFEIASSRSHVFGILTDFAGYQDWMPGCRSSKVVSSEGLVTDADVTLVSLRTLKMRLRFRIQDDRVLHFRMVRGRQMKSYFGSWHLMDSSDGAGTVVRGQMEINPGGLIPRFVTDHFVRRAIDETAVALRRRAEQIPEIDRSTIHPGAAGDEERPILRIEKSESGDYIVRFLEKSFRFPPRRD